MSSPLSLRVAQETRARVAAWPEEAGARELEVLLHYLGRWRSQMLSNTFLAHHGGRVLGGPFAGLLYPGGASEGALMPRLLGVYESELHPHITRLADEGVDCVIDVGCAEGYYAVGLARLMPEARVYAYDINPRATKACAEMATLNEVSDRLEIGGEFAPADFERFAARKVLAIIDTEGAEVDILRPELAPSLAGMNIIVETHDLYRPGAMQTLIERFDETHEIIRVIQQPKTFDMPPWLAELSHMDQLMAVWEWRQRPTPWLVMRPKPAG